MPIYTTNSKVFTIKNTNGDKIDFELITPYFDFMKKGEVIKLKNHIVTFLGLKSDFPDIDN